MFTLFMFGSAAFWILLVIHGIILVAFVENERPGWATASFIALVATLGFLGDFNIVKAAFGHLGLTAGFLAAYFVLGTVYAAYKWKKYVTILGKEYDEIKVNFLKHEKIEGTDIPDHLLDHWQGYSQSYGGRTKFPREFNGVPQVEYNKRRVLAWMCYWPWLAVWTVLNDPVRRAFKLIFEGIKSWLQSFANKQFAGVASDFRKPPPPQAPAARSDISFNGPATYAATNIADLVEEEDDEETPA